MLKGRKAFTLIEVMVSVVIISIVILALLQIFANNTHIFLSLKNKTKINQYSSFFMSNIDRGFEDETTVLHRLVEEFPLEDELRRELKEIKIKIVYQELEKIDMSDFEGGDDESQEDIEEEQPQEEEEDKESTSNMVFEVGKTILKMDDASVSLLRLRIE